MSHDTHYLCTKHFLLYIAYKRSRLAKHPDSDGRCCECAERADCEYFDMAEAIA